MPARKSTNDLPVARREDDSGYVLHGRRFADPYLWMEDLHDPEVHAWIGGQEVATRRMLDDVPGREWLRNAVARATRYGRKSPPIKAGTDGREFWWETAADDDGPRFMMRRSTGAQPEAILDPNGWPDGEALVFAEPSPDGALVAFGKAVGSEHNAVIHVLEVATGKVLPDRPHGTEHGSLAWHPDSRGFFYSACPEPGTVPADEEAHWNAVYEHRIGDEGAGGRIFGDDDNKDYWCTVKVSECGRFAVLTKWDFVHANEVYLLRLADRALLPVATGMRSINTAQVIGDRLLIHTDLDAPRGRACVASLDAPTEWSTLIPEGDDILQSVVGVGGRLYAVYSHAAAHRVRVFDGQGVFLRELTLPALGSVNHNSGDGVVSGVSGSWASGDVWVRFESYVQAPSTYRYDFDADRLAPFHVPECGLDPNDFVTKQVWYESRDGTQVSMFIVHHRALEMDGNRPVRLSAYGGFNISVEPRFSAVSAAWLQMGGVLAFANIRGGGEYGREWHEAAVKTKRQNAFDDYIEAARWLVAEGYTTPGRLASRGNSNGGLLVATTALQAPDAFGAVFCRAPLLDMLRFPHFGFLSAATVEYGSPDDPVEGPYLAGYSPYHNVRSHTRYPPMVFLPALNDRTAPPHDPVKMVARLQGEGAQGGPFLLLPLRQSGHGGATTLSALVEQEVDEVSFYCWALGVAVPGE